MITGFLTGSQVYGTPKSTSDLDIVLYCTQTEGDLICANSGDVEVKEREDRYPNDPEVRTCRAGGLNFILCHSNDAYIRWSNARDNCMKARELFGRQLTRVEAVELHKKAGV